MTKRTAPIEMLLWSIAMPGFGQLLNRMYVKGIVLIMLEVIINMGSRLNLAIMSSFQGETGLAVQQVNYQWLMFYPCVYMFAIWDAFRDAGGGRAAFSSIPFVSCAFFGTIGIMYSPRVKLFGVLPGPVWLPIGFALAGLGLGVALQQWLSRRSERSEAYE